MKSKKREAIIISALFAVLCVAQTASAFYAPNLQRWVNRDPANDEFVIRQTERAKGLFAAAELRLEAMGNLYSFCHNSPPQHVDGNGLHPIVIGGVVIGGGVAATIGQGVTIGAALCLVIPSCREALRKATEKAIEKCRPVPREREKDDCDEMHLDCIMNPWQPPSNPDYGKRKDCFSCLQYCRRTGRWPTEKCP